MGHYESPIYVISRKSSHYYGQSDPLRLTHSHTMTPFDSPWKQGFENVGKGENAGYKHFLLFPQCFLLLSNTEKRNFVV